MAILTVCNGDFYPGLKSDGVERDLMLKERTWSDVPGAREVKIFPLIRKPSILCSNSFLLSSPTQILVIDPGADSAQVEDIQHILTSILNESPRPVFVYLSHCHIDHFFAMPPLFEAPFRAKLLCHAIGTQALNNRDRVLTVSDMHAHEVPTCPVWSSLFQPEKSVTGAPPAFHPFEDIFQYNQINSTDISCVPEYEVAISDHDWMEVFYTPGHSPDSISFRIGDCLFVGDLPFATDMGVAGLIGWDSEALSESLNLLLWIGQNRNIRWVLPGHGIPFPLEELEKTIQRQQKAIGRLSDLIPLDRKRLLDLLDYAHLILDEISAIFAIMAARLLKTVHWLEILDEEEQAVNLLKAIDLEAAEKLIDDFHYFRESFKGKEVKNVILVRAVSFMARFDKIFTRQSIPSILNPLLIGRIRNLFSEFYHAVYGFQFSLPEVGFDLCEAVQESLNSVREPLVSNQAFLDAAGTDQAFCEALASRIADHQQFKDVQLIFEPQCPEMTRILMDKAIFQDLLLIFLERLSARGFDRIQLVPELSDKRLCLSICATASWAPPAPWTRNLEIIQRIMHNHGGDLHELPSAVPARFVFEFPQ